MNRKLALLIVLGGLLAAGARGVEPDKAPGVPADLPAEYKGDKILPSSVSPDGQYGLLFPRADAVADMKHPRLFLVALKPFRVLVEVPLRDSDLLDSRSYYAVNWAKDSSAVAVIEGSKWGPDRVFVVPIQTGQAGKPVDLTAAVEKIVRPDFLKSKAERYNDYYEFVFDSEDNVTAGEPGSASTEKGWDMSTPGRVGIFCTCTTDPKGVVKKSWTVRFLGTWDIAQGKFIRQTFHPTKLTNTGL